ncbi:hypothetical protein U9M48_041313 [Paspalum notatum var. saurae]|uniref:MULE transposase domain-containing protein n=1 Tax=Paspalum notatum var. saurae TaxID=547442 RepID=A0AAQ3USW1_PASNO
MKSYWKASIVTEHTCLERAVAKCNRNLTSAFVANEMYSLILDNLHYEPKQIIVQIERIYNYTISYAKAWRAKQKVFEMRFGTYKDSYDNLPHVKQFPNAEEGRSIVQRVFFCFGPCVRVFQYCRPILCIDGTFLTGQYNGTILTAIGIDGNNQVLPVAFAFVEGENTDSWYWFLERVKNQLVSSRSDVCLISDRHSGILHAIDKLKYGNGASPPLWPDVHSRWCMRHLAANFHDHFKNKELTDMFKRLYELTAKQATESSSSASIRTSKPFSQWIQDKPKEKWALLYDTNGKHYRIMTTNIAESYNMVMRGSRGLPLVGTVEFIMYGCAKYFRERYIDISADLTNP